MHPTLLNGADHKEGQPPPLPSKEIYLVHYNGFVFGANFSKIIIIREREAKKDDEDDEQSELEDSDKKSKNDENQSNSDSED